jgi:diaminopimelate decarboxylase
VTEALDAAGTVDAAAQASTVAGAVDATAPPFARAAPTWWRRPGLDVLNGRLSLNGADLEALVREHGAPVFAYDLARPAENMRALQRALARAGLPYVTRFALKACPDPRLLAVLRAMGEPGTPDGVGIDACSPGEVTHALANGWPAEAISHTGTNVSERDLDVLLAHPIRLNLDAVSQLERVGRRAPGRTVGIRINPGAGAGYTEHLAYAGERPTKFGVTEDRLDDAIAAARRHGLVVDTMHFHAGSGWLGDQLEGFEAALVRGTRFLDRLLEAGCPIREVNVGGGLGVVARQGEVPVDLDAYARVVRRHLGPYGVTAAFEPGDLVMKDAGLLLGEVVTVERRGGTTYVGLDIGWNVNCAYFIYRYAQEVLPVRDPLRDRTRLVTIAGHINEAGDLFAEEYPFPDVSEGDVVAILNAGGYLMAMTSTHSLRPTGTAVYLERPA